MAPTDLQTQSATARNALVVIAVILTGAALYWLSAILTPLALAVFLMVMIDSLARVLEHRVPRFPPIAALPVAITLSVLLFGLAAFVVAANASAFAGELFGYAPKLNALIAQVAHKVGVAAPTLGELLARFNSMAFLGPVADGVRGFTTTAVLVMIYLGFLLISRRGFARKSARLFTTAHDRQQASESFLRIRNGVERYLWIQTVTGGVIALASWGVMAALKLDNAMFWGFSIFIISYVPVIGGAIGIIAPPLFALVQFNGWWQALTMLAGLQAINFVVGNIIYPRMQGRSLNIDPVVLLLSLAFWGALWGLPGMFLSTPLTVTAVVLLAQFRGTRWIAVLLSSDGDPLGASEDAAAAPDPSSTQQLITGS
jgi:predicted PurR-regulated permease PerM